MKLNDTQKLVAVDHASRLAGLGCVVGAGMLAAGEFNASDLIGSLSLSVLGGLFLALHDEAILALDRVRRR